MMIGVVVVLERIKNNVEAYLFKLSIYQKPNFGNKWNHTYLRNDSCYKLIISDEFHHVVKGTKVKDHIPMVTAHHIPFSRQRGTDNLTYKNR